VGSLRSAVFAERGHGIPAGLARFWQQCFMTKTTEKSILAGII